MTTHKPGRHAIASIQAILVICIGMLIMIGVWFVWRNTISPGLQALVEHHLGATTAGVVEGLDEE